MNVFVLNAGRCGSTTWIRACAHIDNYTSGHESRAHLSGPTRLAYPPQHIEADNRLSWFLGRLDQCYGDDAFYVHLMREREPAVASFARRDAFGIMQAYRNGILLDADPAITAEQIAADYLDTVEQNIRLFLRDKTRHMSARLETLHRDFGTFWSAIDAQGDRAAALAELDTRHNRSA